MIDRYVRISRILRTIVSRCWDGDEADYFEPEGSWTASTVADYICRDVRELKLLWPAELDSSGLDEIVKQATSHEKSRFRTLARDLLPPLEDLIDQYYSTRPVGDLTTAIVDLLHPTIMEAAYSQFRAGHYREAVLNAVMAVFDLIRNRARSDKDGAALVAEVFSLENPLLVLSNVDTESGRNEQKGFIQILQGAYIAVRNPKAHSLASDLDQVGAAQYLVFASLLARRVSAAKAQGSAA